MKIVDYDICLGEIASELIENVQTAMRKGFQPFGIITKQGLYHYQPMVKYETEKESFDKSMAEEIKKLSEDLNEKLFSELLKTSIKENEILRETILSMIERYSKYYHSDGYFIKDGYYEYYSKSHESYPEEILNQILQRRKGIFNEKINPN